MTPPPGRLTVAAAQACAPWYRIAQMVAKLQRALALLERAPAPEAAAAYATLGRVLEEAGDAAAVCVAAAERNATAVP